MAKLKRSNKAGRPPSPIIDFKQPKMAKKTESPPDLPVNLRLSRARAKGIAGHIRAAGKRRQGKRDTR